jgi:YggT family protein
VTGLSGIVAGVGQFYIILIIVYVLMSWLPMNGAAIQDVYRVIGSLVEPYLGLFRRFIPPMGGMDFSPIVAILLLQFGVRWLAAALS